MEKEEVTKMKKKLKKILVGIVAMTLLIIGIHTGYRNYKAKPETELKFVFVHGLSGWGSYDLVDQVFPYWVQ
mgnify:CR=1 FL=1